MKRIVYIILILLFAALILKSCLKKDSGYDSDVYLGDIRPLEVVTYDFEKPKNVTINGVDYLQARGDVGKFGGEIISSTIGEGPKTFNPFNANDNTSAQLAGIMYDGLFTTDLANCASSVNHIIKHNANLASNITYNMVCYCNIVLVTTFIND